MSKGEGRDQIYEFMEGECSKAEVCAWGAAGLLDIGYSSPCRQMAAWDG